jgi:16S rRNA (guanine966-N2)-methyltransferase
VFLVRVIAGSAKGRTLIGPKSHAIRPALDKVKGAIFNILFDVTDLNVLDVFAGTGSIGIEALSRGARYAVFLDASPEAIGVIQKNLELCRFNETAKILRAKLPEDLRTVAKRSGVESFDLIFVDPPYDKDLVNPALRRIAELKLLAEGGRIIVEHSPRETIQDHPGLNLKDQRNYGQTLISFLEKVSGPAPDPS